MNAGITKVLRLFILARFFRQSVQTGKWQLVSTQTPGKCTPQKKNLSQVPCVEGLGDTNPICFFLIFFCVLAHNSLVLLVKDLDFETLHIFRLGFPANYFCQCYLFFLFPPTKSHTSLSQHVTKITKITSFRHFWNSQTFKTFICVFFPHRFFFEGLYCVSHPFLPSFPDKKA